MKCHSRVLITHCSFIFSSRGDMNSYPQRSIAIGSMGLVYDGGLPEPSKLSG